MKRFALVLGGIFLLALVPRLHSIDQNGDGMSDVWQRLYQVPPEDADKDYDGDGMTNAQEAAAGTDPRNPASAVKISGLEVYPDNYDPDYPSGYLNVTFPTVPTRRYQLQISSDLDTWEDYGDPITATALVTQTYAYYEGTRAFARIVLLPDENPDGDAFTNWEEYALGTDPLTPNGFPSYWFTDPVPVYWDHDRDEGPNSFEPGVDGEAAGPSTDGTNALLSREVQTAPDCQHSLQVQNPSFGGYKVYYREFLPQIAGKPKFYLTRTFVSALMGGCPESPVGGTATSTFNPTTGMLSNSESGRPYSLSVGNVNPTSPTHRHGEETVTSYDDPPNEVDDCPGTGVVDETLSDEYTTERLLSDVAAKVPAFNGNFQNSYLATAVKDTSADETYGTVSKLKYRFAFTQYGTGAPPKRTANWLVTFFPKDGGTPQYDLNTWTGEGDYTPEQIIDPSSQNGGALGTYKVNPLPVYISVNYSTGSTYGQVFEKTQVVRFAATDYYNGTPSVVPPGQPVWYMRQLQANGEYNSWTQFGTGMEVNYTLATGGVFQAKAVFEVNGKKAELHYVRRAKEEAGNGLSGEIDAFGVVDNYIQISTYYAARGYLGSTDFAVTSSYSDYNGVKYKPGDNKCNLFVYVAGNAGGAYVPLINSSANPSNFGQPFPPSANQWGGSQTTAYLRFYFSSAIPNWDLQGQNQPPQPGWIVSHPAVAGSGHVGIIDYDGYGIGAGRETVNKKYRFFDGTARTRRYTNGP